MSDSKKVEEERMVLARQRREKAEQERLSKLQEKLAQKEQRLDRRKLLQPENVCIPCFSLCAFLLHQPASNVIVASVQKITGRPLPLVNVKCYIVHN